MTLSAYVPCFNNAATIRRAVESTVGQMHPPVETLVIDDGSTDGAAARISGLHGVRVIRHECNLGRGAARARAMRELNTDLIACCDATNVLVPGFVDAAARWFADSRVAAVVGRIDQPLPGGVAERWRGRHLFKTHLPREVRHYASLATGGAVVRRAAVLAVGNYDERLRHSEDADLGTRLLAGGFDVVYDPRLTVLSLESSSVAQVLERYWRWHAGADENVSWRGYWKNTGYSIKVMARADLRASDVASAAISVVTPHYQFWRSRLRRRTHRERTRG